MSSLTESLGYESLTLEESLELKECKHASHCLIYMIDENIYYSLLQLRFDGLIGFPGGEVDVHPVTLNAIIEATNRELFEEINYNSQPVDQNDWICSHRKTGSEFVQHFFAKQLSVEQFRHLEKTHMNAEHFPSESLGVFRIPIGEVGKQTSSISRKFLNNFLRQQFAGNAKQQLLDTIKKLSLLSSEDQKWIESNSWDEQQPISQTTAQILLFTDLKVDYHEQTVNAIYGLMVIRSDGLFDFVATTFIEEENEENIIRAVNHTLSKELGSNSVKMNCVNATKTVFDDKTGSTFLYKMKICSSEFSQIERKFTEAQNFISSSYGIFRIPLAFYGENNDACHYRNRFFKGYSKQNFAHISKQRLVDIWDKFKSNI